MAQHFLLSAASRTLSLRSIYKAGEDAAYQTFCEMRWPETNGEAVVTKKIDPNSELLSTRKLLWHAIGNVNPRTPDFRWDLSRH